MLLRLALAFCCMLVLSGRVLAATVPTTQWLVSQQQPNTPQWLVGSATDAPARVPLGSLWKLWIYSYSVDNQLPDRPYACHAGRTAAVGDEYCCSHAESVSRDMALVRSCGAYFEPQRLQIHAADWQRYWQRQAPQAVWLQHLHNLRPQTSVSVGEILNALSSVPPATIAQTRTALLGRLLQPQWSDVLALQGSGYRFKTFTWAHPQRAGASIGGAAGWLADGSAFWLGGSGGSHQVVQQMSSTLVSHLPLPTSGATMDAQCVVVRYFNRYPIQQLLRSGTGRQTVVTSGILRGDYVVQFGNGQSLPIRSNGTLSVQQVAGQAPEISGRFGLEDYVARVVDREGNAAEIHAARALAVAARSYLLQNAERHQGCLHLADDSRYQRVSPNPPSDAARAIAAYTEGLVLTGSPIRYHLDQTQAGVFGWQDAVVQSRRGIGYMALLKQAYPKASWQLTDRAAQCRRYPEAAQYLMANLPRAERLMAGVAGFEPVKNVSVCLLDYGNPYADQQALNLYVRDWRSQNDRITLWHEYLHLAMRFHPRGSDEGWVERQARQLTDQLGQSATNNTAIRKVRHAQ